MEEIQKYSSANKCIYISSENNPAGGASKGITFKAFTNITTWFQGPAFSLEPQPSWEKISVPGPNPND